MPLFVAGQQVGANKLLVTADNFTVEDLFWVIWTVFPCQLGPVRRRWGRLTIQFMALEVLCARVELVAAGEVAGEAPGSAFATGTLLGPAGLRVSAAAIAILTAGLSGLRLNVVLSISLGLVRRHLNTFQNMARKSDWTTKTGRLFRGTEEQVTAALRR